MLQPYQLTSATFLAPYHQTNLHTLINIDQMSLAQIKLRLQERRSPAALASSIHKDLRVEV